MSRRVHRLPPFSVTASLYIKGTSAIMLSHGITQVTILVFQTEQHTLVSTDFYTSCSSPLFLSTLLSLSLLRIVASLNTLLVYSTLGALFHNCC
ncbi:unnamed protein product [Hymenolepis diminuta]|uniref:Uncharacterized protein n=1 Tax=Hymenolepis diminuta TaxID=6216 RepID=A0A564XZI6_HYMDI|nr:unnamed protein product [Hymenolepis diminuta]